LRGRTLLKTFFQSAIIAKETMLLKSLFTNLFKKTSPVKLSQHWDNKYADSDIQKLGWFESASEPSLSLIKAFSKTPDAYLLDVGSGASLLIDNLIEEGYTHLIAADISKNGLNVTKNRLGKKAEHVRFIVDDITNSSKLRSLKDIDIWHDRAVLHFFKCERDRNAYVELLKSVLKPGGHAIISTFGLNAPKKCSGLSVHRYDAEGLSQLLGDEFKLIKSVDYLYTTTWGQTRPFVYTVFKREEKN
jgi:SAM-dependent methyltransferase